MKTTKWFENAMHITECRNLTQEQFKQEYMCTFDPDMSNPTQRFISKIIEANTSLTAKITDLETQAKVLEEKHLEAFYSIYNSCIGELTMGQKMDEDQIGSIIYEATGMNIEEMRKAITNSNHNEES